MARGKQPANKKVRFASPATPTNEGLEIPTRTGRGPSNIRTNKKLNSVPPPTTPRYDLRSSVRAQDAGTTGQDRDARPEGTYAVATIRGHKPGEYRTRGDGSPKDCVLYLVEWQGYPNLENLSWMTIFDFLKGQERNLLARYRERHRTTYEVRKAKYHFCLCADNVAHGVKGEEGVKREEDE